MENNENVFISITPKKKDRDSLKVIRDCDGSYTLFIYDKNGNIKWSIRGKFKRIMKLVRNITKIWFDDNKNKKEK